MTCKCEVLISGLHYPHKSGTDPTWSWRITLPVGFFFLLSLVTRKTHLWWWFGIFSGDFAMEVQIVWEIEFRTLTFYALWHVNHLEVCSCSKSLWDLLSFMALNTCWALLPSVAHAAPSRVTFKFLLLESIWMIYILLENFPLHVAFQICWQKEQDFSFTITSSLYNLKSYRLLSNVVYLCFLSPFRSSYMSIEDYLLYFICWKKDLAIVGLFIKW